MASAHFMLARRSDATKMFFMILLCVFVRFGDQSPRHLVNEKINGARGSLMLQSPNSYRTYKIRNWLANDIMQISFNFQTRDINGQLASASLVYYAGEMASTNEGAEFVCDLFLKNGLIHSRFGLANEHRRTHFVFAADASDGKSHSVNLTVYPVDKRLSLAIDGEIQQYSYRHFDQLSKVGEANLLIGYSGKETGHVDLGIVGCISNLSPKLGDQHFNVDSSEQIGNGCIDACSEASQRCPSKSDCVNLYTDYKCDCYSSGKEGDDCAEDSSVVSLDGTNGIRYDLVDTDNSRIRRIGLAFKTFVESEQILFDGHLNHMIGNRGKLTAKLTNSQKIAFAINGTEHLYEIGTDNFADGNWHFITIVVNLPTKTIDVKVDDFSWMSIGLKSLDLKFSRKNPVISFGSSLGEDSERNLLGCMKELYVNYDSVLFYIKQHRSTDSDDRKLNFGCGQSQILHPYQPIAYANQEVPQDIFSIDEGSAVVDQENAVAGGIEKVVDVAAENGADYEQPPAESQTEIIVLTDPADELLAQHSTAEPQLPMLKAGDAVDAGSDEDDADGFLDIFGSKSEPTFSTVQPVEEVAHTQEHHVNPVNFHVHQDVHETAAATLKPKKTCADLDCANGGNCIEHEIEDAKCICKQGFIGKTCLFSSLPRSCDELFNMGERRSGVYIVDPVGSDDESFAYVNCIMEETTPRGITIVDHNFPNSTQVRSKNMSDTTFHVSYKFMTENALKHLVDSSLSCKQHVRYDCNQAPLQFMMSSTFFESAHKFGEPFARIGTAKGKCPCSAASPSTCTGASQGPNNTCNCDSSDAQALFDEGDMANDYAAITKLTFLQYSDRENGGKMSLGPLVCEGSKGYDDVVQFRVKYAQLTLPAWNGRSFSFWFRTSNGDNTLVTQYSSDGTHFLKVTTVQAHILDVKFNLGGAEHRVEVSSQKPVNDSRWHKVLVENVKNVLRFSLDDQNSFHKLLTGEHLDAKTFTENLYIGSNPSHLDGTGFVGCMRQFIEDNVVINLNQLLTDQSIPEANIITNCQDKCLEKHCKNNAECVEDYENQSYKCQCLNPRIHLGNDCGTDINKDSDVSFHDSTNSFVNLTNLPDNPVTSDIVFSFKTDQTDALLMYAHDQDYNFIQVHLSSGNKISLTANFDKVLKQCTITRQDKEFDTMEWIQIIIDIQTDYVALYADKLFCRIEGRRTLSDDYVETWDNSEDVQDVVVPPRSPFKPKQTDAVDLNTILFMGGVPNLGVIGRRNKRQSFYQTYIPNLLGGVRGLRVGEKTVNLQHEGVRPKDNTVKTGSNFGCEALYCKNGGHCNVAWMTPNEKATCDCSATSFAGADCTEDNGVTFDGKTYVAFDMKDFLDTVFVGPDRSYDNLRFTFSSMATEVANDNHTQLLVDMTFTNKNELKLTLHRGKGHLHLAVTDVGLGGTKGLDIGGSYADGTRHFVYIKFSSGKILIRVDQQHTELKSSLNLEKLDSVTLGGAPESQLTMSTQNYTGCMSNAVIEFTTARVITVTPLVYATNPSEKLKVFTTVEPAGTPFGTLKCADYKVVTPSETVASIVVMPDWYKPLARERYNRAVVVADGAGSGGNYGVAIGLIILLLILLLVLGIFLYYKKCRKQPEPVTTEEPIRDPPGKVVGPTFTPGQDKEEKRPLIDGQPPISPGRHSRTGVIEPNQGELPDAIRDLDKFGPMNQEVYDNGFDPVRNT